MRWKNTFIFVTHFISRQWSKESQSNLSCHSSIYLIYLNTATPPPPIFLSHDRAERVGRSSIKTTCNLLLWISISCVNCQLLHEAWVCISADLEFALREDDLSSSCLDRNEHHLALGVRTPLCWLSDAGTITLPAEENGGKSEPWNDAAVLGQWTAVHTVAIMYWSWSVER